MPRESRILGRDLNRSELALLFGVANTTIDNWRNSGLPCKKVGKSVVFNSAEAVEWRLQRAKAEMMKDTENLGSGEVTRRTAIAEMEIKVVAAAKATGDAISVEECARRSTDLVATVRSKVMAFAARYSPEVAQVVLDAVAPDANSAQAEEARLIVEARLRDASNEVLTELSEGAEESEEVAA